MVSLRPAIDYLSKAVGHGQPDLLEVAAEQWDIAPEDRCHVEPAIFLKGQLDKILGTEFATHADVVHDFVGDFEVVHGRTVGYRLKDVDLIDGVLYAHGAARHLRKRSRYSLAYRKPETRDTGVLFESWLGNRWFGNYLSDDCITYLLAAEFGHPFTSRSSVSGHIGRYEELLGMNPLRFERAHFDELIVFSDQASNAHKRARVAATRAALVAGTSAKAHPGVYMLRGTSGMLRRLVNEEALAQALAAKRGFTVLDPEKASADEIVAACSGARVVAGVEGSHLVHGLMSMPVGATLFVVQPPYRVTSALKMVADRSGQSYAFVVAEGGTDQFSVNPDDVMRTLDLALA